MLKRSLLLFVQSSDIPYNFLPLSGRIYIYQALTSVPAILFLCCFLVLHHIRSHTSLLPNVFGYIFWSRLKFDNNIQHSESRTEEFDTVCDSVSKKHSIKQTWHSQTPDSSLSILSHHHVFDQDRAQSCVSSKAVTTAPQPVKGPHHRLQKRSCYMKPPKPVRTVDRNGHPFEHGVLQCTKAERL